MKTGGFLQSNLNYGSQIGVALRFNLFNGGNTTRLAKNAVIERENIELKSAQTRLLVENFVVTQYQQQTFYQQQLGIAKDNLKTAEKMMNIAQTQLNNGAISGFEFRQSQLAVLQSQNEVVHLTFILKTIEIELNRLNGQLLSTYLD